MDQTPSNPTHRDEPVGDETMGRYTITTEGDRIVVLTVSATIRPVRMPGGGPRLVLHLRDLDGQEMKAQLAVSQANDLRRAVAEFLVVHDGEADPTPDAGR